MKKGQDARAGLSKRRRNAFTWNIVYELDQEQYMKTTWTNI